MDDVIFAALHTDRTSENGQIITWKYPPPFAAAEARTLQFLRAHIPAGPQASSRDYGFQKCPIVIDHAAMSISIILTANAMVVMMMVMMTAPTMMMPSCDLCLCFISSFSPPLQERSHELS